MRTYLLVTLVALVPGLAFPGGDSELKTNALPPSPYLGIVSPDAVHQGTIVVVPDNEDLSPPQKNRWLKFEEALGPGRTANNRYHTSAWRNNDGSRVECIAPCVMNCCVGSGQFSPFGNSGYF
jgi:hypothetical protein